MPTLREVLLYNVALVSGQIHDIKIAAFKTSKAKKWGYVHTNGTFYGQSVPKDVAIEDVGYAEVEYDKVTSHINPKHKDWRKYLGLKAEATRLFGGLVTVKTLSTLKGGIPISMHLCVDKIQKQLDEGKRDFTHVDQWVKQRELLKQGVIKEAEVHA